MALNPTQKVTAAEITYETYEVIDALADDLIEEQEDAVIAYIALWNAEKDDVDLQVDIDGVSLHGQRLLDAITGRVRKIFGLPLYSPEVYPGSVSIPVRAVW